jgi:IclR family transcriptional regulator, KDG regulon repressor
MPTRSSVLSNTAPPRARESIDSAPRARSGINSGLDVLECLAASEQPLSLTDIAAALGMAKSSVHQLLQALDARGYVQRQADQRYGVGVKAWEVGCRATFVEIGRVAEPYMAELVRTVGEGAALAVLDGSHTVCIQIAESPQVVRVHRAVGERNPAHVVSNGLALLATLSDDEVKALLPRKLQRLTPKTLGSCDEVLAELRRIRQRGYAVCRGAWRLDVGGVAVAIRGADHRAVAGVSIALPLERLTPAHQQRMATALMATAQAIERTLGGPAAQAPRVQPPARPVARRLAAV